VTEALFVKDLELGDFAFQTACWRIAPVAKEVLVIDIGK